MTEPINPGESAHTSEPAASVATAAVVRPPGPSPLRIAIVSVGLVAILGGAAITFAASKASPTGALTGATNTTSTTVVGGVDDGGPALDGAGFGHHGGFGQITVTAINGSSLSLKTADGWTRTITVSNATTYSKAGATIRLSDLKVGDQIRFKQTRQSDGSYTIDAIAVVLPHLGGQVTAINGSTITVQGRDGTTGTIKVTSSTTFQVDDNTKAALADIKVGAFLVAEGTKNSDGSLNAARVVSFADHGPGRFHLHLPGNAPGTNGTDSSVEG